MTRRTNVRLDRSPQKRGGFGIAARLTLAFTFLAGLAAIGGASSSWFSMQSAAIVTNLGSKVLPTVTASLAFAQQSAVLAADAPDLASQTDPAALDQRAAQLDARLSDQSKRLADLREMVNTPASLDRLQALSGELGTRIHDLKAAVADRIAVKTQIQKTVADALASYQDLMDFVRPLQEATQTAVDGEMAPLKETDKGGAMAEQARLLDQDVTTLRTVMAIQAHGNLAFGMLSAAANATADSASDIRSQYSWAELYIGKAVAAFGTTSDDGQRMKKLVDGLLSSGAGNDNVFNLRGRQLDLDDKIATILGEMIKISAAMTVEVKGLVQTEEDGARGAVGHSGLVTRQNLMVNAGTTGLLIAAALLIGGIYVRRAVTNRLKALAGSMKRLAEGDRVVGVPTGGHDEITAMAAAVQVFKTNMIRGDELAAEAARLAREQEVARQQADTERAELAARQAAVVDELAAALARLAHGDLTCDLERPFSAEYEGLRRDFNEALGQLRSAMEQIVVNAGSLHSGTEEISRASDDLSRRTESQATSLAETAAALDEVTGNVRKTTDGALHARDVVSTAQRDARESGDVMRQAVEAMTAIETSSGEIGQIISAVDEIAFQTSLLALNAGVEAARAGDAGRGFAVVASEVRALAQRSAESAKQIKALVQASKTHVANGVELVGRSGTALQGILAQFGEINAVVSEIAASAKEQTHGLEQVNVAVTKMDQVTQQNAAMVEETTTASHSLARDTEALATLIGRFQVEAGPGRTSRTPSSPKVAAMADRQPSQAERALRRA